jgi:hypothetical protein
LNGLIDKVGKNWIHNLVEIRDVEKLALRSAGNAKEDS